MKGDTLIESSNEKEVMINAKGICFEVSPGRMLTVLVTSSFRNISYISHHLYAQGGRVRSGKQ